MPGQLYCSHRRRLASGIAGLNTACCRVRPPVPAGCPDGDPAAVLDRLLATPAPRCDEVTWSFVGMSMANWNVLISLALAGLAVMVLLKGQINHAG